METVFTGPGFVEKVYIGTVFVGTVFAGPDLWGLCFWEQYLGGNRLYGVHVHVC